MPVYETYAKRQKRLRGDLPDVYSYDAVPITLRVQIVHVMTASIGDRVEYIGHYGSVSQVEKNYKWLVSLLRKEIGVFLLPHAKKRNNEHYLDELVEYLLSEPDVEHFLGAVELVCRSIELVVSDYGYRNDQRASENAKLAIDEINHRFKEHGLGYEYDGEIIRIDAELVHSEAVKPALSLLRDVRFKGAEDEFLKGFEHYRKGNQKEALVEALKALESTMKSICDKRGWVYDPKRATASNLLDICFDKELVPSFWKGHFAALRSTLAEGVPTGRNKLGGHGQGTELIVVPDHIASYVLHMTASAIVFLVKADQAMP
jgi:hypothetical protein